MRFSTRSLMLCALFAALMGVCSQLSIPLPMVPINLALFAALLGGALLGPKLGAAAIGVYVLVGLLGVPVFASFGAGPGTLFGKTGGYIIGYVLAAFLTGL
ncbi:MAG: biotin transporter BioY, partial [Clostridiales bacterium]